MSYLTEHAGLFTEAALHLVVEQLAVCVRLASLAPQAFAGIVARYSKSQSPVILQMLHVLVQIFGDELLTALRFHRLLLAAAQSPSFSSEASAVFLSWLWADNPPRTCSCCHFFKSMVTQTLLASSTWSGCARVAANRVHGRGKAG